MAFLSFDIYPNRDFLVLYELWVVRDQRGQGVGAQALEQALRVTRENGRGRLLVLPKPIDDGMTEADLCAWYARSGFVPWPEQDGILQREL